MDTDGLQDRIGYRFKTDSLLRQALTHRSHGQPNNERLEFLGDSVLNCAIASVLFERFPTVDEGDLSRLRAYLVKQQALHKVAQRLALGDSLVLGEGEFKSGGTRRPSILADALEALIGAVYLDDGFETARTLIARLYEPELVDADPLTLGKDAKTLLQEELQRSRMPLPVYSVVATHGAAHNQEFEVECLITRLDIHVLGTGGSRRAAEQAAAANALAALAAHAKCKSASGKKTRKTTKKRAGAKKARKARVNDAAADSQINATVQAADATAPADDTAKIDAKNRKADRADKGAKADKGDKPARPNGSSASVNGSTEEGTDNPKSGRKATTARATGRSAASKKAPDAAESA